MLGVKMKKIIGKVIEVFIPEQYKNGLLLDEMDRTNLGFKVMCEEGLKEIIVEANDINSEIRKDDMVLIIEQDISKKHFVDIMLYEGDVNE